MTDHPIPRCSKLLLAAPVILGSGVAAIVSALWTVVVVMPILTVYHSGELWKSPVAVSVAIHTMIGIGTVAAGWTSVLVHSRYAAQGNCKHRPLLYVLLGMAGYLSVAEPTMARFTIALPALLAVELFLGVLTMFVAARLYRVHAELD